MKRVKGTSGVMPVECVNPSSDKWRVRWDMAADAADDEGNRDASCVSYMEEEYTHHPTMSEIKELITGWFNEDTNRQILSGFSWNGMSVWLSTENQFNYKAAYDLAVQTGGKSLPAVFKFGDEEHPVYKTFDTLDELTDFYTRAMAHIQGALQKGWTDKDSFNWEEYRVE